MRILVDADACPVLEIIENTAEELQIELIIFSDIYHEINSSYGQVIKVDRRAESVDMAIYNKAEMDDIVVTQDYGLAALVLSQKCQVLNNKGNIFTEDNIDYLLMKRHRHSKLRRAGKRHTNPKKRKPKDDERFKNSLRKIINDNYNFQS